LGGGSRLLRSLPLFLEIEMHYKFNQAVRIDKTNYRLGIHEVEEADEKHQHFKTYVACGWIEKVSAKEVKEAEKLALSPEKMNDRVINSLNKKKSGADLAPAKDVDEKESKKKNGKSGE
jgi:hypothetical protein